MNNCLAYRFLLICAPVLLAACAPQQGSDRPESEGIDPFVDELQERTFRWFWETANPVNGLVPDRHPSRPFSSIAAIGFGLTAYGIGAERQYISREQASARTLTTLRFLWEAPQGDSPAGVSGYRGFFYHFLDMETGHRYRTVELSTIDTALLMAGVLFSREYFDRDVAEEAAIRAYADSLYLRVEWPWFQRESAPLVTMAWRPDQGGFGQAAYQGYNEAMILYLLALGSPAHPIGPDAWDAFTSTYVWGDFYGESHLQFSPLFGHQYSHVWVDFREIQDAYMREKETDYFENSRRATRAQRAYAIDNPRGFRDYGDSIWGLTASDGPAYSTHVVNGDSVRFRRYWARGASLRHINDDGTIAPTATGGSIPFEPEITIEALKAMRDRYGERVYNQYGFVDAFNPTFTFDDPSAKIEYGHIDSEYGWFDGEQLGIDQGPIVAMIENHRNALIWDEMKQNPYVVQGLCRAGFSGGWLSGRCP